MRPAIERLEQRLTPTTAALDGAGNLVVTGTAAANSIRIDATDPAAVTVRDTTGGVVTDFGPFDLSAGGVRIIADGGDGNDVLTVLGDVPAELHGGAGNDVLTGGGGDDVLYGEAGNDYLAGFAGNDVLVGGLGRDSLYGSSGADVLVSGHIANPAFSSYAYLRSAGDAWANFSVEPTPLALLANVSDPATIFEADVLAGGAGADWYSRQTNDMISLAEIMPGDVVRTLS